MNPNTRLTKARGADLVAKSLAAAGVKHLFTLSGNQVMPVFDASLDTGIKLIHVRHEAAAVHMADAWARLTGNVGVALLTAGPGHANGLSALYTALAAESPVLMLSGHASLNQLGLGAFQEMPQVELASGVTKASWMVTDATELGHQVARAIRTALGGRPGPVHLSLPYDLLQTGVDGGLTPAAEAFLPTNLPLEERIAQAVLDALAKVRRPLVLTGPTLCRQHLAELTSRLAEAMGIPVVGMESPRGIDDPRLGAFADVLAQADLIVLLGRSLDFSLRFAKAPALNEHCQFIHIDPDPVILERSRRALEDRLLIAAQADPRPTIERLLEIASRGAPLGGDWAAEVDAALDYRPPQWRALTSPATGPVHPLELSRAVQALLDTSADSVLIADGGEFGQWAQACISAPRRVINGPSGAIGGALPFALAARLAFPGAPVVTLMGDGTVGFHLSEFDTAVRYRLPFVAVIGNDARWNAEMQIQLRDYGPDRLVGCELLATRYERAAVALGGHGEHVSCSAELAPALKRAYESGLPACVNVALESTPAPVLRRVAEVPIEDVHV